MGPKFGSLVISPLYTLYIIRAHTSDPYQQGSGTIPRAHGVLVLHGGVSFSVMGHKFQVQGTPKP